MSGSNRRQPTRSVRTSITRPSNYYARPYAFAGAAATVDNDAVEDTTPAFFPAITHFTDAVAALPKEVMQHFTLLRETEGKAYAPEQAIAELVHTITRLPPPPKHQTSAHTQAYMGFSLNNSVNGSATGSMIDGHLPQSRPTTADTNAFHFPHDTHTEARRTAFARLREKLREAIGILDEKNMVLTTANETLTKQLSRLEDTLPYVEQEISEEARLGSNTHWALPHMKELRKVTGTSNERARREIQAANNLAAAAAAVAQDDLPPTRSETRREAMQAKRKAQNVDSDFDDRPNGRKQASGKVRKTQDAAAIIEQKNTAIPAGPAQSHKRRRVEKPAAPALERSASGMGSAKAAAVKEIGGGRDAAVGEGLRKKPKPLSMVAATRKRNVANSPSRVQSPSRGTFTTSNAAAAPITNAAVVRDQSPTPHNPRATTALRGRQNSTQSLKSVQDRIRNPTTSLLNGKNGAPKASTPELKTAADVMGRTVSEARAALTDAYRNPAGERTLEEEGMAGALVMTATSNITQPSRPGSSALKREETEPADPADPTQADSTAAPQSVPMAMTRSRNGISKPAKAPTPGAAAQYSDAATTAPSMARSRSVRGVAATNAAPGNSSPTLHAVGSPRRSHKRGAGVHGPRSLDSPSRSSGSSVDGRNTSTTAAAAPNPTAAAAATTAASTHKAAPKQPSSRRAASPQRRSGSLSPPRSVSPSTHPYPPSRPKPTATNNKNPRSSPSHPAASDASGDAEGDAEAPSSPASDEPRYCVCGQVSYGDMIACDNEGCPREWFHLACVGLTKAPGSKAKWFCDECKEMLRRGGGVRV